MSGILCRKGGGGGVSVSGGRMCCGGLQGGCIACVLGLG